MGHKVHPIGFRIGVIKDWQAKWFAHKEGAYRELLLQDLVIRNTIQSKGTEAGIARVEIERGAHEIIATIHTARPGIVIGRGGQRVDELRTILEKLTGKRVRLNIQEVRQPELEASLVARSVADQIERRISYRRAMKQVVSRTMQAGAKGIKIICAGRLGGAEIARRHMEREGRVPLHTLRADIDFSRAEARTTLGCIGVKVWIYKGDIIPEAKEAETEKTEPIELTLQAVKGEGSASTEKSEIPEGT